MALGCSLALACQIVAFEEPIASTDDDGSVEPEPEPVYNCDPTNLLACPSGQKCTALEVGGVQNVYDCVDEEGNLQAYQICTPAPESGLDSCPRGTLCLAPDEDGVVGFCVPLCDPNQECEGVCAPSPYKDVPVCGDACNPLEQACPVVLECHREDERYGCQFKGDLHDGELLASCNSSSLDGCIEGLGCAQGALVSNCETQNCCTELCDVNAMEDQCTSPHECTPLPNAPPEAANVGICIVAS